MKLEDNFGYLKLLDEAADRYANGCYTESGIEKVNFDIRSMAKESLKLGRPLNKDEASKFEIEISRGYDNE